MERKGFNYLEQALKYLSDHNELISTKITLILFGEIKNPGKIRNIPVNVIYKGRIKDPGVLRLLYQASDWYIHCSTIDNLPNTIIEAGACGTPVIGFQSGGISEIVRNGYNGMLTEVGDIKALADCMVAAIQKPEMGTQFGLNARNFVAATYSMKKIADSYFNIYSRVQEKNSSF